MTTRPATIHAQRAAALDRLHRKAAALASDIATDLLPLYAPGELASGQIDRLAHVTVSSLVNCLEVERDLQEGMATLREHRT